MWLLALPKYIAIYNMYSTYTTRMYLCINFWYFVVVAVETTNSKIIHTRCCLNINIMFFAFNIFYNVFEFVFICSWDESELVLHTVFHLINRFWNMRAYRKDKRNNNNNSISNKSLQIYSAEKIISFSKFHCTLARPRLKRIWLNIHLYMLYII